MKKEEEKMDLMLILGSGAVGKMTVGQELMKITDFRLFHNHMMIEPVIEIFGGFQGNLVSKLRDDIFEEFMKTEYQGLIFTYMMAFDFPSEWEYIKSLSDKFEASGGNVYYVELVADQEERLRRNKTENRLNNKASKRDLEVSDNRLIYEDSHYRLVSNEGEIPFDNYIKIDNTHLEPAEVAKMIKEHFSLPDKSQKELARHIRLVEVAEEEIPVLHDMQIKSFMPLYVKYHDEGSPAIESIDRVRARYNVENRKYYFVMMDGARVGAINIGNNDPQINMPNINFNINYKELKEFKLSPDILNEISNLNQNYNFYYQKPDNYFNTMNNNENRDSNNEIKFNLNSMGNNFKNTIFSSNYISESKINRMNLLPLNKSFYDYTDEEILQYAIPLIKDQSGCRFLQEKLKSNKYFVNEQLFPTIKDNLKELACDSFGNYFLQVLLDILSYDNLIKILDLFKKDFTSICTCSHGTRVIQKLVEKVSSDQTLLNKFKNNININDLGIIFKSPYGNHIMQKYLTMIHSPEHTEFIYNYVCEYFMEIARTKHGVCVIQK